jgi:hypothetical protein
MTDRIDSIILELAHPSGLYKVRSLSEMLLVRLAPGVNGATGVWHTRQPMTPERVL